MLNALKTIWKVMTGQAFKNMAPKEFWAAYEQDPNAVLLDVRTPMEYREAHLKGAKLIDINGGNFAAEIEKLDKNKTYYVYCRSGGRSSAACGLMASKGFTNLVNMSGGITRWMAEGMPVEK